MKSHLRKLYSLSNLGKIVLNEAQLSYCYDQIISLLVVEYKLFNENLKESIMVLLNQYIEKISEDLVKV